MSFGNAVVSSVRHFGFQQCEPKRRTMAKVRLNHDGIDTIYRSRGQIPESFLRGAGVPDSFITYAKSLVGKPIEFYSCFISYSTADHAFAERLHAGPTSEKMFVAGFAPHDVRGGRKTPRAD